MDSLFRTSKAEPPDGALAHAAGGNAERPLLALLAASIILPILIFSGVSWIAYHRHFQDARERLETTLGVIHEHALKVFETFELTARYTDELFADVTDEQIVASAPHYHERLKSLIETLPQLRDIWLIDRNGRPLLSGTIYPFPSHLNVSDREYFAVHRDHPNSGTSISEVIQSRAADRRVFVIARRRVDPAGVETFSGIMTTGVSPDYFNDYYATLPLRQNSFATLMREDGAILARHPSLGQRPARLAPETPIFAAIAQSPQSGFLSGNSPFDTVERMVTYRRLPRHGIYVIVGLETRTIIHDWMRAMFRHLLFGVPATITMVVLAWIALRRTRRESMAYAQLHQEVAQRELTEDALRQSQKMEAVGRLTGGIAHDFNNLLTAILGNVDLAALRLRQPDERVQRNLTSAREAAHRAVSLINRLLAYSRQHPLEVKTVDINRLVQGMSDLVRRAIGETIAIETHLAAGVWKTAIDPNQLETAILNLAVNAKDAMPDGGRLTIETANTTLAPTDVAAHDGLAPGQYVVLAVSDTGAGMSREGDRARVRAVLHDQADRHGHRSRPEHGVRLRQAVARPYPDRQRSRTGNRDHALLPAQQGTPGAGRAVRAGCRGAAAGGPLGRNHPGGRGRRGGHALCHRRAGRRRLPGADGARRCRRHETDRAARGDRAAVYRRGAAGRHERPSTGHGGARASSGPQGALCHRLLAQRSPAS